MLRSQELQTKIFELREKRDKAQRDYMAVEPEKRAAAEPAYRTSVGELDTSIGQQTAALGEAWSAEEREQVELRATVARIGAGDMPSIPPEMRSFIEVEGRASLGQFIERDLSDMGAVLDGAEAEYRSATVEEIGGQHPAMPSPIPWAMFLEPDRLRSIREEQVKKRAVIGGSPTGGTMQDPIIAEVFAASTAMFLGTTFRAAGTGQVIEYVLTSSGATLLAASAAHTAAGSLAATTLVPRSIRSKYELEVEQVATIRGIESAVRADVPRAIMAQIDNEVLEPRRDGPLPERDPAGVHAADDRDGIDDLRFGGRQGAQRHRRQVRAVPEGAEDRHRPGVSAEICGLVRVEHRGERLGLPPDEHRRHHVDGPSSTFTTRTHSTGSSARPAPA